MLSSNASKRTSSINYLTSLKPHHCNSGSRSKSPLSTSFSDGDGPSARLSESDDIYVTKSFQVDVEKALISPNPTPILPPSMPSFPTKTKPKPLVPVISAFSTYKRPKSVIDKESISLPLPTVHWKESHSTNTITTPNASGVGLGGGGRGAETAVNSSKTSLSFVTVSANDHPLPSGLVAAPKHSHSEVPREASVGRESSSSKD